MILNGHHRWAAALRLGFKTVPVKIVNLTQQTDIEKMLAASKHDKRVSLDLDETIFCGPNWNFGAGGAGNADFLRARGFSVETIPFEQHDGAPVSSTRIRAALKSGDIPLANAMLGRPFAVCGEVMQGKGMGRKMGFPTLNIRPSNACLPELLPFGVYVADTAWGRGVVNWGLVPTMGEQAWTSPVIEVHVVERGEGEKVGQGEGAKVEISLVGFLRPEMRFGSIEALRKQIESDVFSASHSAQNSL